MNWFVYIAESNDGSFYTGITKDVKRRELEHNHDNKLGAKSLRGKRPVKIVYFEEYNTQKEAAKREYAIKQWKKEYKIKLIDKLKISKGLP